MTKSEIKAAALTARKTHKPQMLGDVVISVGRIRRGWSEQVYYTAERNGQTVVGGHTSVNTFADILLRHEWQR